MANDSSSATPSHVTDSNVLSGLWINLSLGGGFLLLFCVAQSLQKVMPGKRFYRFRTMSESVTLRPNDIPMTGLLKYVRWMLETWRATDIDVLVSCGLDALVMLKLPLLGIQLFTPIALVGLLVLVPVSVRYNWLKDHETEQNSSRLAWLTISAIAPDSELLWLHFAMLYLYTFYALALLYHHFLQFARLRLLYIRRGDDLSFYMEVLQQFIQTERARIQGLQAAADRYTANNDFKQGKQTMQTIKAAAVRLQRYQAKLEKLQYVMQEVRGRVEHLQQLRHCLYGPALDSGVHFPAGSTRAILRARHHPVMYVMPRGLWKDYTLSKMKQQLQQQKLNEHDTAVASAAMTAHDLKLVTMCKESVMHPPAQEVARRPVSLCMVDTTDSSSPSTAGHVARAAVPLHNNSTLTQSASAPAAKMTVSGAGHLALAEVQALEDTAPLTFLERPSARYQASMLVPVGPTVQPAISVLNNSCQLPPRTQAGTGKQHPTASKARDAGDGHQHLRRRVWSAQKPACKELGHHNNAAELPWGDANLTGALHLQAVQVHRYAVLVTDVPVPPFPASSKNGGSKGKSDITQPAQLPKWQDSTSWFNSQVAAYVQANPVSRFLYDKVVIRLFPSFGSPLDTFAHSEHDMSDAALSAGQLYEDKAVPEGAQPVGSHTAAAVAELQLVSSPTEGSASKQEGGKQDDAEAETGERGEATPLPRQLTAGRTGQHIAQQEVGQQLQHSHFIDINPSVSRQGDLDALSNTPEGDALQKCSRLQSSSTTSQAGRMRSSDHSQVLQVGASRLLKLQPSMRQTKSSRPASAIDLDAPDQMQGTAGRALKLQSGAEPEAAAELHVNTADQDTGTSTARLGLHFELASMHAAIDQAKAQDTTCADVGVHAGEHHTVSDAAPQKDVKDGCTVKPSSLHHSSVGARSRAQQLWAVAARAVQSGQVAGLPSMPAYDPVSALFSALFPHAFDRALPIMDYQRLHVLMRFWNNHMIGLDSALEYLASTGRRPWHMPCPGGCWKPNRVDSIAYLTELVGRCQRDIIDERRRVLSGKGPGTGCYVVLFKTQAAATLAASSTTALSRDQDQFMIHPAPSPANLNWHTLLVSNATRRWMTAAMLLPKVILILIPPVAGFASFFMQLDYLLCPPITDDTALGDVWAWTWYCSQNDFFSWVFRKLVVGWLPSLLLSLYSSNVLPNGFHGLCQSSFNHRSLSDLDQDVCGLYFLYNVWNVLLCGMLGATFAQQVNKAISAGQFLQLLGAAAPQSSNFFINYLIHRALFGFSLKLLVPHGGVPLFFFKRYLRMFRVFSVREQMFRLYTCRSPRYGPEIGNLLMGFVLGCAFAVVSPLASLAALVFFAAGYFCWKYQLLYMYVRKYETGGMFFHFIFERLLGCLAIMVIFTAAVLGAKGGATQSSLILITLPWIILYVGMYVRRSFGPLLGHKLPLEVAAHAPRAEVDPRLFIHPALHPQGLGWHPDLHMLWGGVCIWGAM